MDAHPGALKIVKRLREAGYIAYFAGGWVRDYLLKHPSDDIDIATDASPEVICSLFPHTILVGVAFGVVVVVLDGHQYEVTTFRRDINYVEGRRPEKVEPSSPQEDAIRRDFTINGMFYDPFTDSIHDFVEGREDLKRGLIRAIGQPHARFAEDRLRMIRAIRFAARFGFEIDEETQQAIQAHAHTLLPAVAMERIWQEFGKMAAAPRFGQALVEMHRLGLLSAIFPILQNLSGEELAVRVALFDQFPRGTPPVLYLLELFPDLPLDELLELGQYLRVSGHESKLMEFAVKGRHLLEQEKLSAKELESWVWAQFYADRLFHMCFDVLAARYPETERQKLHGRHRERRERLLPHIQRLVERKPLVTATMLKDYGIKPGKQMGILLKEAEKIAIEHDLHDPLAIIKRLQETPHWPK